MLLEQFPMAANKPRYFQVVCVPGEFKRGRWICSDYKEGDVRAAANQNEILVFDKSHDPIADLNPATIPLTNLVTNAAIVPHNGTNSASVSPSASTSIIAESSETLVVTSVAQAKVEHANAEVHNFISDSVMLNNSTLAMTSTFSGESVLLPSVGQVTIIGSAEPPMKPLAVTSIIHSTKNNLNASTSAKDLSKLGDDGGESSNIALLATGGTNVVAIDNKIEQAMDLVKKHLTFAVREEVEELKSAIFELEGKVSMLESHNQLLKQYAPPDVVANLTNIVHTRTASAPPAPPTVVATTMAQSMAGTVQSEPIDTTAPSHTQTQPRASNQTTSSLLSAVMAPSQLPPVP